jgi:hypothetical protein
MNYLDIILFHLIWPCFISNIFSQAIKGICGFPNIPYRAKLSSSKPYYVSDDEVFCECENKYIDFIQSRKCQKGEWSSEQFICGMEWINLYYKNLCII